MVMTPGEIRAQIRLLEEQLAKLRADDGDQGDANAAAAGDPIGRLGNAGYPKPQGADVEGSDVYAQLDSLRRRLDQHGAAEQDPPRKFAEAQSKADQVAMAYSDTAPAAMRGETLTQYRNRLLRKFQARSARWRTVNIAALPAAALDVAEAQIYADAVAAANDPATVPPGELRAITTTDQTGRRITRFIGDPEACWSPFKQPTQRVVSWPSK